MSYKKQPLVLISGFKAGTWLMRKILSFLTGMEFFEPDIIPGEHKYYNPKQLQFVDNHFYSWHLVPTTEVIKLLNENSAQTIFVVRNVYDLVVSIYYHFYNNIDADIGRGNNKHTFLQQFSFEEGISLIITGFDEGNGIRWNGMAEVLKHYNEIFRASTQCDNMIIDYDELVNNKEEMIVNISKYLNLQRRALEIEKIVDKSSFSSMKKDAKQKNVGTSHFREGKASFNREKLSEFHKIQLRQMIKLSVPDIYENAKDINFESVLQF